MTESEITGAELTTAQAGEVLALIEAARLADGVAPLSEHGMLRLSYGSAGGGRATRTWIRHRGVKGARAR
jgi:hypothetical protein